MWVVDEALKAETLATNSISNSWSKALLIKHYSRLMAFTTDVNYFIAAENARAGRSNQDKLAFSDIDR